MHKIFALTVAFLLLGHTHAATTVSGELVKWHPIHLDVEGPTANESDNAPNPFLDIRLDIVLTRPSGEQLRVPGFFAGDGNGAGSGNIWRARFAANEAGTWQYQVELRQGNNAAVLDSVDALSTLPSHGDTGQFEVAARNDAAPGFLRQGRIEYIGEHYLKFADGPYFIKSGVDSPENFFGYAGFDNTINQSGGVATPGLTDNVHRYGAHVNDYQTGDPNFVSEDTGVDAKGIIGAINYLSSQGINYAYFLPMNLGGDARDTYPFISPNGGNENNSHYDVSKLHQWNIVLNHMQRKGVVAHIVLNEQETGNTQWLDGGELGNTRKLFYRELIARFSYLNGIKWNLSEESRHGTQRHIQFARYIRSLDWAEHPLGVHTWKDNPDRAYNDLLGVTDFDITSIQFSKENANQFTEVWRSRSSQAGWPWVIDMDEVGPGGIGMTPSNTDELRKWVLYPVYFSGGNLEWYFGYHGLPLGGDMRTEDFSQRESMFRYTRIAREFIESNLPFWQMTPNDDSLSGRMERDQVFSLAGQVYAVYLENGESGRTLQIQEADYNLSWFNPRSGEFVGAVQGISGTSISLGQSPADVSEDWVVLVREKNYELPTIQSTETEPENTTETETTEPENTTETEAPTPETNTEPEAAEPEISTDTETTTPETDTNTEPTTASEPDSGSANPDEEAVETDGNSSGGALSLGYLLLLGVFVLISRIRRYALIARPLGFTSVQLHQADNL